MLKLNWTWAMPVAIWAGALTGCSNVPPPVTSTATVSNRVVIHGAADGSNVWIYDADRSDVLYCSTIGLPSCSRIQPN